MKIKNKKANFAIVKLLPKVAPEGKCYKAALWWEKCLQIKTFYPKCKKIYSFCTSKIVKKLHKLYLNHQNSKILYL